MNRLKFKIHSSRLRKQDTLFSIYFFRFSLLLMQLFGYIDLRPPRYFFIFVSPLPRGYGFWWFEQTWTFFNVNWDRWRFLKTVAKRFFFFFFFSFFFLKNSRSGRKYLFPPVLRCFYASYAFYVSTSVYFLPITCWVHESNCAAGVQTTCEIIDAGPEILLSQTLAAFDAIESRKGTLRS